MKMTPNHKNALYLGSNLDATVVSRDETGRGPSDSARQLYSALLASLHLASCISHSLSWICFLADQIQESRSPPCPPLQSMNFHALSSLRGWGCLGAHRHQRKTSGLRQSTPKFGVQVVRLPKSKKKTRKTHFPTWGIKKPF